MLVALKEKWLLASAFSNVINPRYLETKLYPGMTMTAVNKMKHWIYLNLTETKRCEEFFQYYSKDFNVAIKFLVNCSNEFVLSEVVNILDKLMPHHLKVLCEKCPEVAKIYFDKVNSNEKLLSSYLNKEIQFYNSLKGILKLNCDIYLDITEKYFNHHRFNKFSSTATKYIMSNYRSRYNSKPDLYAAWLLDIKTLAQCLHMDEIKELVLRLARAEYLDHWFCYIAVEPLIKRLSVKDRTALKKQVFVDKSIGERIKKWPYETPSAPEIKHLDRSIFQDRKHHPEEYTDLDNIVFHCGFSKRLCKKKKGGGWARCEMISPRKSSLDQLFDRYRFTNFQKTMSEFKTMMTVENVKNRQNMMLVLVSKSGGHPENVEELLKLLVLRHINEPLHLRATVIRSLVKRSFAWRLPQEIWELFTKFGKDLGLDGKLTTANCREGLHAVVLRNILEDKQDVAVWNAFIKIFTNFSEYSLNLAERKVISMKLPALLLSDIGDVDQTIDRLCHVLETVREYRIPFDQCPGAIVAVKSVAKVQDAEWLLRNLFNAKIARKELFKEYFAIINHDASFLNALKHDTDVLESVETFEQLIDSERLNHDRFIRKLALYFSEENGLAEEYLSVLLKHLEEPHKKLACALALLGGERLVEILQQLDSFPKYSPQRRLARILRTNVHLARPIIDMDKAGWKFLGVKAIANRVITCSNVNVARNVEKLMQWQRTERLAFVLSMRVGKECSVLATIGKKRPKFAVNTALFHLRKKSLDVRVWDVILPLIAKCDPSNNKLDKPLCNFDIVPSSVKYNYCVKVLEFFSKKESKNAVLPVLCVLELILPEVDERFVETMLVCFINDELTAENVLRNVKIHCTGVNLYMRLIAKFLLLCINERTQQNRIKNIAEPFLKRMADIFKTTERKSDILNYLDEFFQSLHYNKVFFDPNYVSCLPVFEVIARCMKDFLPMEMYFSRYAKVHITMIYFKSVRQSIKNNPAVFEDLPENLADCVRIVGHIFGKHIAHETAELVGKYFESVKEIYKKDVVSYLTEYFDYSETKNLFIESIVKSIIDSKSQSHLVAEHIVLRMSDLYSEDMLKLFNECETQELRFFMCADL